ncbi:hypothetical protein R1flu_015639 [Riccia fluitans]|uniref:Transcription activator GCR1-like domain-containing protein n=1 Tax=Riccia fluitans TaxID=41844 RepID=A0ABD1YK12_9MARC
MQCSHFGYERSSDWYNIKLLKSGANLLKELDYRVDKESVKFGFEAIGLKTKAKTHVGRGSGARMVELGGANHLTHVMAGEQDPTELQLQRVVPILEERIIVMHEDFNAKVFGINLQLSQQTEEIKGLRQRLEDILSGKVEMRLTARFDMDCSRTTSDTRHSPNVAEPNVAETTQAEIATYLPRTYKLSRGIVTVSDLWREWAKGLGGGPAIRDLEKNCHTTWCEGNERRFFNRRKLGFRQEWLCKTFWLMALGTGAATIGVGAFANLMVDQFGLGLVSSTFIAAAIARLGIFLILNGWGENIATQHPKLAMSLFNAFQALIGTEVPLSS